MCYVQPIKSSIDDKTVSHAPRHAYGASKAAIDIPSNPKLEAPWPITT
jgi:hypothetical protein